MGGFRWERAAAALVVATLAVAACGQGERSVEGTDAGSSRVTTDELGDEHPDGALLRVTDRKDGDSFVASDGIEYRLGLVNAPELSQPCGREAADFTDAFLADGFRAEAYATDTYGRTVAEVFDTDDRSLNVALADSGLGNDRYLDRFRHENPELADRLDDAFAGASVPECAAPTTTVASQPLVPPTPPPTTAPPPTRPPPSPPPPTTPSTPSGCHPAYATCVPIEGDGSGNGGTNDLDCGEIGYRVQVAGSADPYRLDRDGDGWGCESYG